MLRIFKNYIYRLRLRFYALKNFRLDFIEHILYSLNYHNENEYSKGMLRCSIMLLNHQLEKAQTYVDQRDGYGREKVQSLLRLIKTYIDKYGYDSLVYTSIGVIKAHLSNNYSFKNEHIGKSFDELIAQIPDVKELDKERGGVISVSAKEIEKDNNFIKLLHSRHSCRQFAEKKVSIDAVRRAVEYAQTAPSACNRQCVRVHYYDNPDILRSIIMAQKSDVQWCLKANGLFIVTADREYFRDYYERNQRMFDAGLFSMILCLGLHNEGIGSCFKMAQKEIAIDKETKTIANIPQSEDICVLLLIGYYPEEKVTYAKSSRIDLEEVLTIH